MGKEGTHTLNEVDPREGIGGVGKGSEDRALGLELGVASPGPALAS